MSITYDKQASLADVPNGIILFQYPFSPFARRLIWYLTLRGIPYAQCIEPHILPRPDLALLGVKYRRIPLLSIGRSVYLDTRLILKKLEAKFPDNGPYGPPLGASKPSDKAIERLLEKFNVDAGIFGRAASLIPPDFGVMQDPKFLSDRKDLTGRSWDRENILRNRPESIVYMREAFNLLEDTLLGDGRDWVLGGTEPSLADIEAIWPFDWVVEMKGALPSDVFSKKTYPKVYAWIDRFRAALKTAKAKSPKPITLKGAEAAKYITSADVEQGSWIDPKDPITLEPETLVELYPIDSGFSHRDKGHLVGLTPEEIVIKVKAQNGQTVHVHAPRWGFRLQAAKPSKI